MAFERIALAARPTKGPAGITITQHGKIVLAVRKDLVSQAGITKDMTFSILLGTDEDAGKLRIVKDKDGVPCARELKRTGAFFFNLGPMPAIGIVPHKQKKTSARIIDDGIEIDLPPNDGPKLLLPPPSSSAAAEVEIPKPRRAPMDESAAPVNVNGVSIDMTPENESVTFNGKSTEVTARQAKLIYLLARPRPSPVSESFLINALWDGKPAAKAVEQLRQICADLQKGLSPIGLDLRPVKGVGYQIKDL